MIFLRKVVLSSFFMAELCVCLCMWCFLGGGEVGFNSLVNTDLTGAFEHISSHLKSFASYTGKIKMIWLPGAVEIRLQRADWGAFSGLVCEGKYQETIRLRSKMSLFFCLNNQDCWEKCLVTVPWQVCKHLTRGKKKEKKKQPGLCILEMSLGERYNVFNL